MTALNVATGQKESTCRPDLVSQVIAELAGNPELAPLVFGLYAGPQYPDPGLDYPPTPALVQFRNPLVHELDLDTQRIERIVALNAFTPNNTIRSCENPRDPRLTPNSPVALYLLPSHFNHSCASNAMCHHFKDVMVIRAIKDLEEGEEITIPYVRDLPFSTRQVLLNQYLVTCDCLLCNADRIDGEEACRRRSKLANRRMSPEGKFGGINGGRAFLCAMEATYSPLRGPIRPDSARAHHWLSECNKSMAKHFQNDSFWIQCITENIAALEALGASVADKTTWGPVPFDRKKEYHPIALQSSTLLPEGEGLYILYSIFIMDVFHIHGDLERAIRWFRAALWCEFLILYDQSRHSRPNYTYAFPS